MFTTWPGSPLATIPGTNALMPWMTPHTLTSKPHFQSASSWSQMNPSAPEPTPALLQSTWTPPWLVWMRVRELGNRLVVGDVDDDAVHGVEAVGAQLGGRVLDGIGAHVGGDRDHPLLREALHHRQPDAARAAGDDGDLAAQIFHVRPPEQAVDTRL